MALVAPDASRAMEVMSPLELAILRAVVYASLFDYPLTLDELHETLVTVQTTREAVLSAFAGSGQLAAVVERRDGFFFPAGRRELVEVRRRRETRSRAFLARYRRLLALMCAIPFTRAVALSGSIAHLNLEPEGDLDLFIVTRGRRVWTVTVAMLVLTRLLGVRRIVCANFVLADTHLALEQQDLFAANQVLHLKPLMGDAVLDELVAANPFVARTYPNVRRRAPFAFAVRQGRIARAIKAGTEAMLAPVSPVLEACCRRAYGWHLQRRSRSWRSPGAVRLQADALKLHTKSHRDSVMDRFERSVEHALQAGRAERRVIAKIR